MTLYRRDLLPQAAERGNLVAVNAALSAGADSESTNFAPRLASLHGHLQIVNRLPQRKQP